VYAFPLIIFTGSTYLINVDENSGYQRLYTGLTGVIEELNVSTFRFK
jgi:hypothetical protein